jgi:exosome complex component RRP42
VRQREGAPDRQRHHEPNRTRVSDARLGGVGQHHCPRGSSPAAHPHLGAPAMDNVVYDLTIVVNQTLANASLLPPNLAVIPRRKVWRVQLDLLVISDAGNVYDTLFLAARAALWDTKVPCTRAVEFNAPEDAPTDVDMEQPTESGFDTRTKAQVTNFELDDYWDEGAELGRRKQWPICVTMNLVRTLFRSEAMMAKCFLQLPPVHYLDATLQEEASTPLKLLVLYSFPSPSSSPDLQAMRMIGASKLDMAQMRSSLSVRYVGHYTGLPPMG